jgi:hypothetical protein
MSAAEIVVRNVERDRRNMIMKLPGEAIGQAGKPALAHPRSAHQAMKEAAN